jgi:hypothetical protein
MPARRKAVTEKKFLSKFSLTRIRDTYKIKAEVGNPEILRLLLNSVGIRSFRSSIHETARKNKRWMCNEHVAQEKNHEEEDSTNSIEQSPSSATQKSTPSFMKPKGSFLRSYEPKTGADPERDKSNTPTQPNFPTIHSDILPSIPRSSKWSMFFRLSKQNFVCISHLTGVTCPDHFIVLYLITIILM